MSVAGLRLVFLDAATFGDVSLEHFSADWDCILHPSSSPDEVPDRLTGRDAVVVNKVTLDSNVLASPEARELKLIAVAATGTDNVDLEAARAHGIRVCNVPRYATQSVAQFTMALILELATHAGRYQQRVRAGAWQRSPMFTLLDYPAMELCGKSLGIIGLGSIGQAVAGMARSFGMEVLVSARPNTPPPIPPGRIDFSDLLKRADVVTLHCPLTPETQNLIDSRALSLMKPTAFLVNTARGGLVHEGVLVEALKQGRLAGAALDVLSREPPPADHPVIVASAELENLVVTPHCAWSARESRQRLLDEVAENVRAFISGAERNCVV